ncbi:hypothetical protein IV203_002261 [Nitzschia inconspicua]|uniref:Uncharacterized protein n=1 Tax=Nitzschia inconspicua TaxID=303405 RepID=A0A9K3LA13_9STRA|nr:hypothetical protein IV203_002261 [Nitzschia inconspicua]
MTDPNHEYLTMAEQEELQLLKRGYLEPTMIPNGLAGDRRLRNRRSCDPRINEHRFDGRGNLRDTVKNLDHDGDRHDCKLFLLLKATQETEDIIFSMNDDGVVEVEFCNVDDGLTSRSDMVALIKNVKATWEEDADWHRENKAAATETISRWAIHFYRLRAFRKAAAASIITRWAARHHRLRSLKKTACLDVESSSAGIPLEDSSSTVGVDSIESPTVAIKEPTVVQDVPSKPQEIYDDAADIITIEDGSNVPTVVKGDPAPVAIFTNHSDGVNESMDSVYDCIPQLPADRDVEVPSTGIPLEDSPSPVQIGRMESPPVANEEIAVVQDVPSKLQEIYDGAADIITIEGGSNVPTVVKGNLTPVATGTNHSDEVNESMDSGYDCIPELPPDRDVEDSSTGIPLEDSPSPVQIGRMESPPVANEEVAVAKDVPSRPEEPLVAMETTSSIEQENLGIANDETVTAVGPRTPVHPPSEAESEEDPLGFAATFAFLKDLLESE